MDVHRITENVIRAKMGDIISSYEAGQNLRDLQANTRIIPEVAEAASVDQEEVIPLLIQMRDSPLSL